MEVSKFLNEDFVQFSIYSTARSLCNYIDGFKISHRKVIHTFDKDNITEKVKVAQVCSRVAENEQYLHGEQSLVGVIVGLAQNYTGSNNINLLDPNGSFGTRFIPEAAASRYIFTRKTKIFDKIIIKDDYAILPEQSFEGSKIEPKYYLPILPLSLVNGSEGIGSGFAQKILPRNPFEIIDLIESKLKTPSTKIKSLPPYYKGFKGNIIKIEDNSYSIQGIFEIVNTTKIKITELPIGRSLQEYLKVLNSLIEDKVIKDYTDRSENDNYYFELDVPREFTKLPKEKIMETLKLSKKVSENFTCLDENNLVVEFKSDAQIIERFIPFRLNWYQKRKDCVVSAMQSQLTLLKSKQFFIKSVIEGKIVLNNKKKDEIVSQIQANKQIIKVDDSYNYLLNMPLYSITAEKIEELKKQICNIETELNTINSTSIQDMWIKDLNELKKELAA